MTREESITFYKAHARRLFNISRRIVGDSGEAEEIMQDTILGFISSDIVPKGEAKVRHGCARPASGNPSMRSGGKARKDFF